MAIIHETATIHEAADVGSGAQIGEGAVIREGARVGPWAVIGSSAVIGEGARVSSTVPVRNGARVPSVSLLRWRASLSGPDIVTIGCQTHTIEEWLHGESLLIPWGKHCTPEEKVAVQLAVQLIRSLEGLSPSFES